MSENGLLSLMGRCYSSPSTLQGMKFISFSDFSLEKAKNVLLAVVQILPVESVMVASMKMMFLFRSRMCPLMVNSGSLVEIGCLY